MDETAVIIAGIGGQGIQLLSKVLARAALAEGRHVMLASEYGGEMRGGRSFASVVIGEGPLRSLPVIERADLALVLHENFWEESDHLLKAGGLAFVESAFLDSVAARSTVSDPPRRFAGVAALDCAKAEGSSMGGGLALLGAFCAHTRLAAIDNLVTVMEEITPPYRRQHIASNERVIRAGAEQVPRFSRPEWAA
jgi:2-oxoglutarate ferredoxin oxidoreductase subunit gamma